MTIQSEKQFRGFSPSLGTIAAFFVAVAPWFWIADFLIDLPMTIAGILFAAKHIKGFIKNRNRLFHTQVWPDINAWQVGFVSIWVLFLLSASLSLRPEAALPLAVLWVRHPIVVCAMLLWLARSSQDPEESKRIWEPMAWSFTVAVVFVAIDSLFQWQFGHDFFGSLPYSSSRLSGPFNEPIVGFVLVHLSPVVIAIALAGFGPFGDIANPQRRSWLKTAFALYCLGLVTAAVLVSGERLFAAWQVAGLGGLMLVIVFTRFAPSGHKRLVLFLGLSFIFIVLGIVFAELQPAQKDRIFAKTAAEVGAIIQVYREGAIVETTNSAYANIHLRAAEAIAQDPLTGHGMLGFRYFCPTILNLENTNLNGCSTHPHHTWLAIGIAGGIPAILLAAMLLLAFFVNRLVNLRKNNGLVISRILTYLPLWALAPMLVSPLNSEGFFINFTENVFWSSLGICLAMERCVRYRSDVIGVPESSKSLNRARGRV